MSGESPSAQSAGWILGLWWDLLGPTIARGLVVFTALFVLAGLAVGVALLRWPAQIVPGGEPKPRAVTPRHRRRVSHVPVGHAVQYRAGRVSVDPAATVPLGEDDRAVAR